VTAVALIPLTLWFATKLVSLAGADHAAFVEWLRSPLAAILMILLLIALFHHLTLGLEVIIEDYVHSARMRWIAVSAVQLGCIALAVAGVISVARIAFGG
jgi:succinate dehydrogenase / fumarate reductase membrane anchor subunit